MFKEVKKVEIELFSKCNRHCAWCPNKILNRNDYIEMKEETFLSILYDLKENKFEDQTIYDTKLISFSRFCEPFFNTDLLKKRTKQVRNILPIINICLNSNGDYLTKKALQDLHINTLSIMDYDCKGIEWCKNKLQEIGAKNITTKSIKKPEGIDKIKQIEIVVAQYENIKISYTPNWPLNRTLENRAGFLKEDIYYNGEKVKWKNNKSIRNYPCLEPQKFIAIDYNGYVTPCCHIRSDNPEHKNYILGNVNTKKLSKIYCSDKAQHFKNTMLNKVHHPEICKYCQKITFEERKSLR